MQKEDKFKKVLKNTLVINNYIQKKDNFLSNSLINETPISCITKKKDTLEIKKDR